MKTIKLIIYTIPFLLLNCSTGQNVTQQDSTFARLQNTWQNFTKKESSLFTLEEKNLLQKTTSSINFRYGYDIDLEIDYVYAAGKFSESEIRSKSNDMKKILEEYTPKEIISFYEKIFEMKEIALWNKNNYKENEDWKNYTFLDKYLIPEIELFTDILEKNTLSLVKEYKKSIDQRKKQITYEVEENLY